MKDKFLQEIIDSVAYALGKKFEEKFNAQNKEIGNVGAATQQIQQDNVKLRRRLDAQEQAVRKMNVHIEGFKFENGENIQTNMF